MDHFLQLLITELQNQDPLNPMENSEILQQVSQIREIGATNLLTDTLQTVLTGQNLATASGMIGKSVQALADDNTNIQGIVDRVSVEVSEDDDTKRTLRAHIGNRSVSLENIREIVSVASNPVNDAQTPADSGNADPTANAAAIQASPRGQVRRVLDALSNQSDTNNNLLGLP